MLLYEKTLHILETLEVLGANVMLLDKPTNYPDPESNDEVLGKLVKILASVASSAATLSLSGIMPRKIAHYHR